MTTQTVLARTWNRNESGLLWECEWYREGEGDSATFWYRTFASGVFVPPYSFGQDITRFWKSYAGEAGAFYGEIVHQFQTERLRIGEWP